MDDLEAETQRADLAEAALKQAEYLADDLRERIEELEEALRSVRKTLDEISSLVSGASRYLP